MLAVPHDWLAPEPPAVVKRQIRTKFDLRYVPEFQVLLCTGCKVAVPKERIRNHVRIWHRGFKGLHRVVTAFQDVPAANTVAEIAPRPDVSTPLGFLMPPRPGFSCPRCAAFRTTNWDRVRQHLSGVHKESRMDYRKEDLACFLQQWTASQGHFGSKPWIVDTQVPPTTRSSSDEQEETASPSGAADAGERTLAEMEADEEARLLREQEQDLAFDEDLETDENSHWLRGCGWPHWFHQKPIPLLVTAASVPADGVPRDLFLGRWHGLDCVSPAASERRLQLLVSASHQVLSRCQGTLRGTPRILRCWVRSWTTSFFPYPFESPSASTVRRYSRVWISGVCYYFRMHLLARRLHETTAHLGGFQLSDAQKIAIDDVWDMLSRICSDDATQVDTCVTEECLETIFQLFVTMWTQLPPGGELDTTAVAHFSGILGIHPSELSFRRPYSYTPFLSALIWIGRLILLEYALPLRAYSHLAVPWPSRDHYADLGARLCAQIRPKYLLRGSMSPLGYLIERLQHGRAIAKREGPPTNISWSMDNQTLSIDRGSVSIPQFRRTVHAVITRAQQQLEDLLFDWWPEVQLGAVGDDMANCTPGYSFLSDARNNLQFSFRKLSRRAFSSQGGLALKGRGRQRAYRYLKDRDYLVQLLFAAIHLTSGMPARGEELRLIRWANTATTARNIFIHNGTVIFVFRYNKACTNHNNSFYVVRRPCPAIEKVLFIYLAYIRPFSTFLNNELQLEPSASTNKHLFTL